MAESEEEFDTWDNESENLTVVTETPSEETSTAPKQRLPRREVSYSPTGAGFPDGFGTQSMIFCVVMMIWTLAMVFYFSYVHAYMVFTQQSPPSSFNGLRITDVPFYNAAPVSASTSEIYFSFDYYTWMTDYLLILLPPYAIGSLLLAVVMRKRSVAIFGVNIVGILFILLEIAKGFYWTMIWAGWLGLSCAKYQFCLSHDPGMPVGTPIFQFKFAVIFAYASAVLSIGVLLTQSIVRSGRLYTLVINGRAPRSFATNKKAPGDADFLFNANAVQRRRSVISKFIPNGNADRPTSPIVINDTVWKTKN